MLTVIAPELGLVEVVATVQPFSHDKVIGLQLDWQRPPGPACRDTAKLSFYSNGQNYHTLQLAYHCPCAINVHRRYLRWSGLKIEGNTIRADDAAEPEKPLKPLELPPIRPEPVAQTTAKPIEKPVKKQSKATPKSSQLPLF